MGDAETQLWIAEPSDGWWRWDSSGDVLELNDGTTVAFRTELAALAQTLAPVGLPPWDAVILLLHAVRSGFDEARWSKLLDPLGKLPAGTFAKLQPLATLASSSLTGPKLNPFIERFFRDTPDRLSSQRSCQAALLLYGTPGLLLHQEKKTHSGLRALIIGAKALSEPDFADSFGLTRPPALAAARSGLLNLLAQKAAAPQPASPVSEKPKTPGDLLDELAERDSTAALPGIIRRVGAGISLPGLNPRGEPLPEGGASGLDNRGPLDRLLLSELAHDDHTLAARIVMREALYVRRESPPTPARPERVILLDTSLRMWGSPRLLGLGAALSLLRPEGQTGDLDLCFVLEQERFQNRCLDSAEAVETVLTGSLSQGLTPWAPLRRFGRDEAVTGEDVILVTHTRTRELAPPAVLAETLRAVSPGRLYLLAVDESGACVLWHEALSGSRRIGGVHLDGPWTEPPPRSASRPRIATTGEWPSLYASPGLPFGLIGDPTRGRSALKYNGQWWVVSDDGHLWKRCHLDPVSRVVASGLATGGYMKRLMILGRPGKLYHSHRSTNTEAAFQEVDESGKLGETIRISLPAACAELHDINGDLDARIAETEKHWLMPWPGGVFQVIDLAGTQTKFKGERGWEQNGKPVTPHWVDGKWKGWAFCLAATPRLSHLSGLNAHHLTKLNRVTFLNGELLLDANRAKTKLWRLKLHPTGILFEVVRSSTITSATWRESSLLPKSPDGHRLSLVQFPGGGRLYFNPLGFVTLVAPDSTLPELSLGAFTGCGTFAWFSDNRYFGNETFLTSELRAGVRSLHSPEFHELWLRFLPFFT